MPVESSRARRVARQKPTLALLAEKKNSPKKRLNLALLRLKNTSQTWLFKKLISTLKPQLRRELPLKIATKMMM